MKQRASTTRSGYVVTNKPVKYTAAGKMYDRSRDVTRYYGHRWSPMFWRVKRVVVPIAWFTYRLLIALIKVAFKVSALILFLMVAVFIGAMHGLFTAKPGRR